VQRQGHNTITLLEQSVLHLLVEVLDATIPGGLRVLILHSVL